MTLFTLASAVCGVSDSQAMLVVARFVQGLGGAGTAALLGGYHLAFAVAALATAGALAVAFATLHGSEGPPSAGIQTATDREPLPAAIEAI